LETANPIGKKERKRMKLTKLFLSLASFTALVVGSGSAATAAGTKSGSFNVTSSVVSSCTLLSAPTLAFGPYDPVAGTAVTGTTTLSIQCTKGTPLKIALDAGSNDGSTSDAYNRMKGGTGGADLLTYQLQGTDSSGTLTQWNQKTLDFGVSANNTSAQTITINGTITAGQNAVSVGSYTDTVTATINY
jgi:spore coat protein U-like protein